jgi:hypothetical protein
MPPGYPPPAVVQAAREAAQPPKPTTGVPYDSKRSAPDLSDFMLRARSLSYDDYRVALTLLRVRGQAYTGAVVEAMGDTERVFRGFAAVYIARECLAGRLPSGEGFIAFVAEQGGPIPKEALAPLAHKTIGDVLNQEQSLESRRGCLRMYFSPVDGTEAGLAAELVLARVLAGTAPWVREGFASLFEQRAFSWFTPEGQSKGSLLRFLCEGYPCLVAP